MSRRPRRRPALVAATLSLLLGTALLAGCSAGAVTQTDTTITTVTGSMGQAGGIAIRNLSLDPGTSSVVPAGATIALRGTLVNEGLETDRLVSVSTPYASGVTPEGPTTIPGNTALMIVGSQPGPVGPAIPGNPVPPTTRITLAGVTQVLHAGPTYPITLTFERGGSVTLPVPVVTSGAVPAS